MGIQLNISTVTIYRNKTLLDQVMFIRRILFMQENVSVNGGGSKNWYDFCRHLIII